VALKMVDLSFFESPLAALTLCEKIIYVKVYVQSLKSELLISPYVL